MKTILIVEDDDQIRELVKEALSGDLFVLEAKYATESLKIINDFTINLLLLDINLQNNSSDKVYFYFRSHFKCSITPVIFYTGNELPDTLYSEVTSKRASLISKPHKMKYLRKIIKDKIIAHENYLNKCNFLRNKTCSCLNNSGTALNVIAQHFFISIKIKVNNLKDLVVSREYIKASLTLNEIGGAIETFPCYMVRSRLDELCRYFKSKDDDMILLLIDLTIKSFEHLQERLFEKGF